MTDPDKLIQSFKANQGLIHQQTEGLTHADSLLQLPFRGNCLNWVLGHLVEHRDRVLALLNQPPTLNEAEAARYRTGSEPITNGQGVVSLEKLLSALEQAQEQITEGLRQAAPEALATIYDKERQQTVGDRIAGLHWHETYHVGQLEILRQLAGPNDAII
jgi:hypothetical protein